MRRGGEDAQHFCRDLDAVRVEAHQERRERGEIVGGFGAIVRVRHDGADRHAERIADRKQRRGGDAVGAAFVFLDLLEGDAGGFRERGLADVQGDAAFADNAPDMTIDIGCGTR